VGNLEKGKRSLCDTTYFKRVGYNINEIVFDKNGGIKINIKNK
jgi:hypothetical protein